MQPTEIAHGAAKGADALAGQIAQELGLPVTEYPANWRRYGQVAGMIRNKEMLKDFQPDAVLAAPGGNGTANMVGIAMKAGVATHLVEPDQPLRAETKAETATAPVLEQAPDGPPRVLNKRLTKAACVLL